MPPPTHRLKQSINQFWLSTTEAFDRDDGSSIIWISSRKGHRTLTAWPHSIGQPHDFQRTHALLKRKNPCLCSGEHVWKDTTWSCRTLVVLGRPREKPPFFSANLATKYKYWAEARPGGIRMASPITEEPLRQGDWRSRYERAVFRLPGTSALPSLGRSQDQSNSRQ